MGPDDATRRTLHKARRVGVGFLLAGLIVGAVGIARIGIAESTILSVSQGSVDPAQVQGLLNLAAGVVALSLVLVAIGGWMLSRLARSAT